MPVKEQVMLAADLAKIDFNLQGLSYPKLLSPKIDGMRAFLHKGELVSRNLKRVPNQHTRNFLEQLSRHPFDGELAVGPATSPLLLYTTLSAMKRVEGEPDFMYYVFDLRIPGVPYEKRYDELQDVVYQLQRKTPVGQHLEVVPQHRISSPEDVWPYETRFLAEGYEGVMLRSPSTGYTPGRSTKTSDDLWKLKRFIEGEAIVVGVEEAESNTNEAFKDEVGRTKRTAHQAGKVGKGMVGTILVKDPQWGIMRLSPGTMPHTERTELWARDAGRPLIGLTVHWRAFGYGVKTTPRFPRYYGVRFDK